MKRAGVNETDLDKPLRVGVLTEPEEAMEVVAGQVGHCFELDVVEFAQNACHLDHVSRLVTFAAMRDWTQVRTIGFYQHTRQRDVLCHFAQIISLCKGKNA